MEIDDQEQPQQLKDRLGSLMNLYLNDKHYELRDEIVRLTDKLYNLKEFTQEKRRTIFELIDKVPLQEDEEEQDTETNYHHEIENLFRILERAEPWKDIINDLKERVASFLNDVQKNKDTNLDNIEHILEKLKESTIPGKILVRLRMLLEHIQDNQRNILNNKVTETIEHLILHDRKEIEQLFEIFDKEESDTIVELKRRVNNFINDVLQDRDASLEEIERILDNLKESKIARSK